MAKKLVKAWNRAKPGTLITTDPKEAAEIAGAILVDRVRYEHLEGGGFFPERDAAIPAEYPDATASFSPPAVPGAGPEVLTRRNKGGN